MHVHNVRSIIYMTLYMYALPVILTRNTSLDSCYIPKNARNIHNSYMYALPVIRFLTFSVVVRHQVPIGRMGNYQEHLKKINPLRELDSGSVRTQLFGNPFKLERPADNKVRLLVQEAKASWPGYMAIHVR